MLDPFAALPTLLGPRTLSTHGLQSLMGCIFLTMHCRSQHCWELLHPFALLFQHTHAITPNIVGAPVLGVVASVCTPLPTRTQQLPTLLAQQCWELLYPFALHLPTRTQQLSTLLAQQCWELLRLFARSLNLKCQSSLRPTPTPPPTSCESCVLFEAGEARRRLTFQTRSRARPSNQSMRDRCFQLS